MSRLRLLVLGVLGLVVLVFGFLAVSRSRPLDLRTAALGLPAPAVPPGEGAPTSTLVPYTTDDDAFFGQLLPVYGKGGEEGGNLVGWTYQDDSDHTCSANPNGVWVSCTFSPEEQPWPSPVPQEFLENPPPLPPVPQEFLENPPPLPQEPKETGERVPPPFPG